MTERVLHLFNDRIEPEPNSGCWLWMGVTAWTGYGRLMIAGRWHYVHRLAYEHFVGPLDNFQVDHLCRVRRCVNPAHMERVTNRENALRGVGFTAVNSRKSVCACGQPYDIVWPKRNRRDCRACKNRRNRESKRRLRAERAS